MRTMTLILTDGTSMQVRRPWWMSLNETRGFHHFFVLSVPDIDNPQYRHILGHHIAVPLSNIKLLILD